MVLRLLFFVASFALMLAIPGGAVGYLLLRGPAGRWRQRRLAAKRAQALLTGHGDRCFLCLQLVDKAADYYDRRGWYHSKCLKDLLGE